jgi:hypothetical protein
VDHERRNERVEDSENHPSTINIQSNHNLGRLTQCGRLGLFYEGCHDKTFCYEGWRLLRKTRQFTRTQRLFVTLCCFTKSRLPSVGTTEAFVGTFHITDILHLSHREPVTSRGNVSAFDRTALQRSNIGYVMAVGSRFNSETFQRGPRITETAPL